MDKMWAGRFTKETDESVNAFNSSISFDSKMYRCDIQGSIAHAKMLADAGIISQDDSFQLIDGLTRILQDIDSGELEFDPNAEDVHMFIEKELTNRLGDVGKKLHTARSRNDQVATDIRIYLREEIKNIKELLRELVIVLCSMSRRHLTTIMPGYTHLQRAQPITFAHHLTAYACMFMRDIDRLCDCAKRMNYSPLGSGALAGTTYSIDRARTAELLEFDGITVNSIDGVSDRDFCIELASVISIIMMHLSRFAEEIIMWCSWEFKFIELDDAFATGSSIMPQKKNPDIAELVRGKAARVFGDNITLLVMMKGLPLAYNKDMQEDKEAVFDACDTVKLCLSNFTPMIASAKINKSNMRLAAAKGFINATDCADYLVKKGMPFRDAYRITGELVAYCIENNTILEDLKIDEYLLKSDLFGDDIYQAINLDNCVNSRISKGGPSPESVAEQLDIIERMI